MKACILTTAIFAGITLFVSCQKEQVEKSDTEQEVVTTIPFNDAEKSPIQLGKKLENPYSVEAMRKAYNNLRSQNKTSGDLTIEPTHFYVRFLPKSEEELDALEKDTILELYDYPLDYEIVQGGNYYHDPEIPEDQPTWKYTAVTVDQQLPAVTHEVLAELYMYEDEGITTGEARRKQSDWELLEEEALYITGNAESTKGKSTAKSKKYKPSGRIAVHNNAVIGGAIEGVPRVKARVRRWFTIKTSYTDKNGYFTIGHEFKKEVNYGVKFENDNAYVKPTTLGLGPAFIDGPKTKSKWNYTSYKGAKSYLWGTIMQGVNDYYNVYAPAWNIGRPPNNLKIKACENNDCGVAHMTHQLWNFSPAGKWLFSDIKIGNKDEDYDRIYKTTIHELGHAAHWQLMGNSALDKTHNWFWAHGLTTEAWACGINDRIYFEKFGTKYYPFCVELYDMIEDGYPRVLVRDLEDHVNEFSSSNSNCNVYDPVSLGGFTLNEIFYSLRNAQGWNNKNAMEVWRDNLINQKPYLKNEIIAYFKQYIGD